MRAEVVHNDVVVFTSAVWDTTCTAIRSGDDVLLVDSPVFPEELEAIPGLLREHRFPSDRVRLFTTHGDWDHILGPLMFPEAPLWCGQSTADRLAADPEELESMMRNFDQMFYVKRREPLSLDQMEPIGVPGEVKLGEQTLTLMRAEGHTVDGTAAVLGDTRILAAGDYVSPVELPRLRGSLGVHLDTLDRLEPEIGRVELVIPGHGHPMTREVALRVLAEDRRYLEQLRDLGAEATLPKGRDDPEQLRIHEQMNVPTAEGRPTSGISGGNLPS
jgi:glyoxylase-like metal-dependent hydrolase (beta-lactamase superfamily II)